MGLMSAASSYYFGGIRLPLSVACLPAHVIQQFLFVVLQVHNYAPYILEKKNQNNNALNCQHDDNHLLIACPPINARNCFLSRNPELAPSFCTHSLK